MKYALVTFGCKVNQYDTELLREALRSRGAVEVEPESPADLFIVNTCTVTAHSEQKARQRIHRIVRDNPTSRVFVVGCAVARDRAAWAGVPGVSAVAGPTDALALIETETGAAPPHGISRFGGHTRAFLKVQDGCDAFCSYCIVPHVRGRSRSRPLDEIVAEARRLVDSGHREIVVTGIHVGLYGRDLTERLGLVDLLRRLEEIDGLARLRLSSIEVGELTDELIDCAAGSSKLCPHLHVPLQSGDDAVLARMNRAYGSAEFLAVLRRVRAALDRPAITTDVMVGFPGESEAEFANTVRVCREAEFSRMHIFPYSRRPGTPAASMTGQVDAATMADREERLASVARVLALEFKKRFVGRHLSVLVEDRPDRRTGLPQGYCPRYIRCLVRSNEAPARALRKSAVVDVVVREAHPDHVVGERVL